jgi:signal transduction histidine kinase
MYPYTKINNLLNKIEFSNKTKLLISVFAFGMLTIGFLMLISIYALKFDYETLYQKRTLPGAGLEKIKDLYTVNIHDTLYDVKEGNIDIENGLEVVDLAKQIISVEWQKYNGSISYSIGGLPEFASNWLNFFLLSSKIPPKNYYQKGITSKVQEKMESIDKQTLKLAEYLRGKKKFEINESINKIFLEISSTNIYISGLISSHLKDAIAEKNRNDNIFKTSIVMLFILIGLTFFLSIIIAAIIINHFKQLNESLEDKVETKTKELRALNDHLEKKIKTEVENSRKKDQIMFQQAKFASLGEMLQNIAHQWRQPLCALTMIIQSFQSKFLSGKLTEKFVESRVLDGQVIAESMSDTLEDFRTFFHPNKSYQKFVVKETIDKAIDLTKYQLEKDGILLTLSSSHDIEVYGFKNELIHVVLNLINNSRDALLDKKIENKKILIVLKTTKINVIINVIDNARGIKNDIIARVFDPYFTTKHQSVGTGIGLYMSKQIVEKHMNGKIWCKNIKHKMGDTLLQDCTMFTIEIPKVHKND